MMTAGVVVLSAVELDALHRVQLEALLDIDRVCKRLGVRYQLAAGTLLGAIRHQGFIPWDDDVDVCMHRADYERFLDEAPKLLDQRFFLQHVGSEQHWHKAYAKLRVNGSELREEASQDRAIHHGIFIDIFPFDDVDPFSVWGGFHMEMARWLTFLTALASGGPASGVRADGRAMLGRLARRLLSRVSAQRLLRVAGWWFGSVPRRRGQWVTCLVSAPVSRDVRRRRIRRARDFHRLVWVPFEGVSLPVPLNYEQVLTGLYGDFMQIPDIPARRQHHFIAFRLPDWGDTDRQPGDCV